MPQDNLPRRSGHATRPPTWTKDYFCGASNSSGTHYLISSYISLHRLSLEHMCYISQISEEREPSCYNEAVIDPQ